MASNLVFTKSTGPGSNFTLFANEAAIGGTEGLVWDQLQVVSPSPWADVQYPGFSGRDAKYFGGRPHAFTIDGYAIASTEALLWTEINNLLNKNKDLTTWALSGPVASATGGGVILEITAKIIGQGTGDKWPFALTFGNFGA